MLYKDYVRDIKTTRVAPVVVTRKAQRQLSLYSKATKKDPHVDYITRKEVRSFKITNVDSIDSIVESDEWQEFFDMLINRPEKAPETCKKYCSDTYEHNRVNYT